MDTGTSSPVFNSPSMESDIKPLGPSSEESSIRLGKILAPVDFSSNSEKALNYGLRLARLTQASILLLHVFETPEVSGLLPEASSWQVDYPELKKTFDAAIEQANQRLAKMAHRVREAQIEVQTQISPGNPYQEIVKVAQAEAVELIVIATHGYTGIKRFFMGSTAERVVRIAPCPVLVVREKERDFVLRTTS